MRGKEISIIPHNKNSKSDPFTFFKMSFTEHRNIQPKLKAMHWINKLGIIFLSFQI